MRNSVYFAIDVGGTKIAGAIFNSDGDIIYRNSILVNAAEGDAVGQLILSMLDELLLNSQSRSLQLVAVGVAVPGIVNSADQTVWAPNIPGWERYPLHQLITDNLPDQAVLKIDNDRACYILGETWKGAAVDCRHAIYLAVGTGIGAGILIDGRVLRGKSDIAGAVGWMALTDQHISFYQDHGCFEHHASGNGIALRANQEYHKINKQVSAVTTEEVFNLYFNKDPIATMVINEAVEFWGKAVANLVSIFNPEKIIFGGGVFGPAAELLDKIYIQATRWAQPISIKQVTLVKSGLGKDAGLYGAGFLVKNLASIHA